MPWSHSPPRYRWFGKMIQEIILALLGHPGQVVEDNGFSFALAVDYPSYLRGLFSVNV